MTFNCFQPLILPLWGTNIRREGFRTFYQTLPTTSKGFLFDLCFFSFLISNTCWLFQISSSFWVKFKILEMVIGHLWVFTWIVVQAHNPLCTYSMGMYCSIRQTLESQFNMTQTTTFQYPFLWKCKRTASWVNNYSILQLRNWKVISCILCIFKCSFNFQCCLSPIYQAYVFLPKRLHSKHCMGLFVYVKNRIDCFRNLVSEWEKHDQSSDIISNCGKGTNDVSCALQSIIITHSIWIRFVVLETINATLRCTFLRHLMQTFHRWCSYWVPVYEHFPDGSREKRTTRNSLSELSNGLSWPMQCSGCSE